MVWRASDPQGAESHKINHLIPPYTRGRGLDIGCGQWKAYPHFIGVDSGKDYGGQRVADIHADGETLPLFADNSLDFVFSSHFLEHVRDYKAALKEWWRVIRPGGHLSLYLPHKNLYPNIGQDGANPDHKHDFLPADIKGAMREIAPQWVLVEDEERGGHAEYSMFLVFRKEDAGGQVEKPWRKPEKSCLVIRYGAFGDALMASSILPQLKEHGWRVTVHTGARGEQVLRHDPNIDDLVVFDEGQIPNHNLHAYWACLTERYDRIINLCESIERTLLAEPGNVNFSWADPVRRRLMNANYIEFTHAIADVPFKPRPWFYETGEEKAEALKLRNSATQGRRPLVLWCLTGSSVHKRTPHLPVVLAWLLMNTNFAVITVGDGMCRQLEAASAQAILKTFGKWEAGKVDALPDFDALIKAVHEIPNVRGRWRPRSEELTIRETLTLAKVSDVVVGPETGVLNAVSMAPGIEKVVMLSHSSHVNLTRDWPAVTPLTGAVECYPCHRMHHDFSHCRESKEFPQFAACAAAIEPMRIYTAIGEAVARQAQRRKAA